MIVWYPTALRLLYIRHTRICAYGIATHVTRTKRSRTKDTYVREYSYILVGGHISCTKLTKIRTSRGEPRVSDEDDDDAITGLSRGNKRKPHCTKPAASAEKQQRTLSHTLQNGLLAFNVGWCNPWGKWLGDESQYFICISWNGSVKKKYVKRTHRVKYTWIFVLGDENAVGYDLFCFRT